MRKISLVLSAALLATVACKQPERPQASPATATPTTTVDSGHAPAGYVPGTYDDWCGGHGVQESQCTRCNPSLIPAFKATGDWCGEHGLPESQCLECNPDLKIVRPGTDGGHAPAGYVPGTHDDWCGGHGVPESQCTRCNPSLIPAFKATGDWCGGHGLPESQCLECNPDLKIVRPPKTSTATDHG